MAEFKVPKQATAEIVGQPRAETDAVRPVDFQVPEQAARDLGEIAGQTSVATELLAGETDEAAQAPEEPRADEVPDWIAERNAELASRDFSFLGGETAQLFDRLSPRKQKKVIAIRDKLLAKYKDRGALSENIGLLYDHSMHRYLRNHGGAVMGHGDDEYYLALLGKPLTNDKWRHRGANNIWETRSESEFTYIRHHARRYQVRNYFDMDRDERPAAPRMMVPPLADGEWLPIVKVLTFLG